MSKNAWIPIKTIITLSLITFLSACGGSSDSSVNNPGGSTDGDNGEVNPPTTASSNGQIQLDSNGEEPRRNPSLSAGAERVYLVNSVVKKDTTVAAGSRSDTTSVSFNVRAELSDTEGESTIDLYPSLINYEPAEQRPDDNEIGAWQETRAANGQLIAQTRDKNSTRIIATSYGALQMPDLILTVPAQPIGVGASWSFNNRRNNLTLTTTVQVESMTDSRVTVRKTLTLADANRVTSSVSGSETATYDLSSLLMVDSQTTLSTTWSTDRSINGEQQTITGQLTMTRNVEVAQ